MVHLITPYYQRKRFFRPRRPVKVWRTVRRYQLLELFVLTGGIALVWLGAHLDNQTGPFSLDPLGVESAGVQSGKAVQGG
jgi:tRNA(Ile)-lysidine synthase TilS/MesJ